MTDANWSSSNSPFVSSYVIPASQYSGLQYIGATNINGSSIGEPYLVYDKKISVNGFDSNTSVGKLQILLDGQYLLPNSYINASQDETVYNGPVYSLTATQANVKYVTVSGITPSTQLGSPIIENKLSIISPSGVENLVYLGKPYILHWQEYASPIQEINASQVGQKEYTPPVGTQDASFVPEINSQVISTTGIESTLHLGNPTLKSIQKVSIDGIDSTIQLGFPYLSTDTGCLQETFDGYRVPLNFKTKQNTYDGYKVPIEFSCKADENNYFIGFLNFDSGESLTSNIDTSLLLKFWDGNNLSITFAKSDSLILGTNLYNGESLVPNLTIVPGFTPRIYEGQSLTGKLVSDISLSASWQDGESLSSVISIPDRNITGSIFFTGENLTTDLTQSWIGLPTKYNIGESLSASISVSYSNLGSVVNSIGESLTATVTGAEGYQLQPVFFEGQSLAALVFPIGRFIPTFSIGETLSSGSLDVYSPQISVKYFDGQTIAVNVASIYDIAPVKYSIGENLDFVLETHPSEPIQSGKIFLGTGESYFVPLNRLKPAYLIQISKQPVPASQHFQADIQTRNTTYTSRNLDLNTYNCCPREDYRNIQLDKQPDPSIRYLAVGTGQYLKVDIHTEPRLRPKFFVGENLNASENRMPTILCGQNYGGFRTLNLGQNVVNIRLSTGNLIPDSSNLDIELVYTYPEGNQIYLFNSGESLKVELIPKYGIPTSMASGEYMDAELSDFIVRFQDGEHMYAHIQSDQIIGAKQYTGERFVSPIYDPPIIPFFGVGESIYLGDITTTYHVTFLDAGCLDNEYIPIDEDGDPIPELFNPVPVELDMYLHEIKAKCY